MRFHLSVEMDIFMVLLVLCMANMAWSSRVLHSGRSSFNVLEFGAAGNPNKDDSQAFASAWKAACGAEVSHVVVEVPQDRTFLLNPIMFEGPCRPQNIEFRISGRLVAPKDRSEFPGQSRNSWLRFSRIDGLTLNGGGQIDGKGDAWWHHDHLTEQQQEHEKEEEHREREEQQEQQEGDEEEEQEDYSQQRRPSGTRIDQCNRLNIVGLTFLNSPKYPHLIITDCHGVSISGLSIKAPETSPNTDGINIRGSTDIHIHNCNIGTGDDCIAINHGCYNVNITHVTCGPGHGISIGSLGKGGEHAAVEEVHVRNCTFIRSTNGARIKSWQGGNGYARKISFQDIILENVNNPIVIDQFYCPHKRCPNQTAAVQISDITYRNVRGTSATMVAVKLACSESIGCTNVVAEHLNIRHESSRHATSYCLNAHGRSSDVVPPIACLS